MVHFLLLIWKTLFSGLKSPIKSAQLRNTSVAEPEPDQKNGSGSSQNGRLRQPWRFPFKDPPDPYRFPWIRICTKSRGLFTVPYQIIQSLIQQKPLKIAVLRSREPEPLEPPLLGAGAGANYLLVGAGSRSCTF